MVYHENAIAHTDAVYKLGVMMRPGEIGENISILLDRLEYGLRDDQWADPTRRRATFYVRRAMTLGMQQILDGGFKHAYRDDRPRVTSLLKSDHARAVLREHDLRCKSCDQIAPVIDEFAEVECRLVGIR
jgi:hypothetical protein